LRRIDVSQARTQKAMITTPAKTAFSAVGSLLAGDGFSESPASRLPTI
jgi:hypothetical protein